MPSPPGSSPQDLVPKEVLDWASKNVSAFRDALAKGVIAPLNLVMLTRERMQEVVDDAVSRGRMTRRDANEMVQSLLRRGRSETEDVLSDLDRLLGRSPIDLDEVSGAARRRATKAATSARRRIERSGARTGARTGRGRRERAPMAQTARARAAASTGTRLPIASYDELTAARVQDRLNGLTTAELRRIRDYERRHANRKTVLAAIETKLG